MQNMKYLKIAKDIDTEYYKNYLLAKKAVVNFLAYRCKINTKEIMIVVGRYKETISRTVKLFCSKQECKQIIYIDQEDKTIDGQIKTMGTGDAIRCCVPYLKELRVDGNENVVILSGDVPLIKHSTIELLLNNKNTLLTTILSNPFGCGRIFTSNNSEIKKIVEEKDCNEEEKDCKLVNLLINKLLAPI